MPQRKPPHARRTRRITYVLGSTGEYVRLTPIAAEVRRRLPHVRQVLVGTDGDANGAAPVFEADLGVPELSYVLELGPSDAVGHLARGLDRMERVLELERPDLVLVAGHGPAALAAAIAAAMRAVPVAHVDAGGGGLEAGGDSLMARRIAGGVATLLFARREDGTDRVLAREVAPDRIHPVGSTMIDALVGLAGRLAQTNTAAREGLDAGAYVLVALRGAALTSRRTLWGILDRVWERSRELSVVLAVEPRLQRLIHPYPLKSRIHPVGPLDYLDFLSLVSTAARVVTDCVEVQEEATHFGVPCAPVSEPSRYESVASSALGSLEAAPSLAGAPLLWDGRAAERVVDVLVRTLSLRPVPRPVVRP
jgi:UDP-N-acetylglucosamine 2-epimerase (non-hydrolysing)